jgi:hypothetical protein
VAVAVAVTVTIAAQPSGTRPGPTARPASAAGGGQQSAGPPGTLTQLASYILAGGKPAGDATLVIREQSYPGRAAIGGADLYTDSGEYFFAPSVSGLPAQIASDHNQGDGLFAREIAAAVYADHGDLAVARKRMAVRAGVLRILSTLRDVTVTNTTTNSQPTLTLRAGAPAMPGNYQETLVIGARTGVPVTFTGGVPGKTPDVTVTYQVTRVTLSKLAAGQS